VRKTTGEFDFSSRPAARRPCSAQALAALYSVALIAAGAPLTAGATPYAGTPIAVPGVFQAENFDAGGESVGYHDKAAGNAGGLYRPAEDVDIIDSTDGGGGYVISHFETGEWLAYTINVAANSRYNIELRVASAFSNSGFHIEIDGVNVTGRVAVPNTSNWHTFQWVGRKGIPLTAGQHVLKIVADQQYFNLDSVRTTVAPDSIPYLGAPISLPGRFEAEHFDIGGEGVAYHDDSAGNSGGSYRPGEDVDIIASADRLGGNYVVDGFEAGEWLAYTVNVGLTGRYDIALRVASGLDDYGFPVEDGAFRVEIDGVNVTGTVAVPGTGEAFQWVGKMGVGLTAGQHILTIVSEQQSFNLNSVRVSASAAAPYSGNPISVPGMFEAAHFDRGGQNVAYFDNAPGNSGGQYRPTEDVDIAAATDGLGGAYVVNHFETGEWLAYSIDVATGAQYDIELRASSTVANSAFHVEIDGVDVTGTIVVPNTGRRDAFQWVGRKGVTLAAGSHLLKIVSRQQYFNLNSIRVATSVAGAAGVDPGSVHFSCTFQSTPTDCGFEQQAKAQQRASIVSVGRDGGTGVRLTTYPGDSHVAGSGDMERNDLLLPQKRTDGYEGREHWWAHSMLFPSDFAVPTWQTYVVFDFHQGVSAGQANFHVDFEDGQLIFRGHGGTPNGPPYKAMIGPISKNVWYDFVYHVKWSSGIDGFFRAWVNGVKKLDHRGPTMHAGEGINLKLANYHTPVCDPYPGCTGPYSSVVHDRVIRGTTPLAVSIGPLEGVLEPVNGVLTLLH
jgi:hypothetical protein